MERAPHVRGQGIPRAGSCTCQPGRCVVFPCFLCFLRKWRTFPERSSLLHQRNDQSLSAPEPKCLCFALKPFRRLKLNHAPHSVTLVFLLPPSSTVKPPSMVATRASGGGNGSRAEVRPVFLRRLLASSFRCARLLVCSGSYSQSFTAGTKETMIHRLEYDHESYSSTVQQAAASSRQYSCARALNAARLPLQCVACIPPPSFRHALLSAAVVLRAMHSQSTTRIRFFSIFFADKISGRVYHLLYGIASMPMTDDSCAD